MWADYKAFLSRGNLIELATAFILGAAFATVVRSFTEDVMLQLVAAVIGQPDFTAFSLTLGGTEIGVGAFLTAAVNFALVALAVFVFVLLINRLRGGRGAALEDPDEVVLLREIRDELRARR